MKFIGQDVNSDELIAINVCNTQGKERYFKDDFRTNISH